MANKLCIKDTNTNLVPQTYFTKFHSKEVNRAINECSHKAFSVFITLNYLIFQYRDGNRFRKLSISEIQKSLPFSISHPSLKKYLDELREKDFIRSFKDLETKNNVYELMKRLEVGEKGYTKIPDHFFKTTFPNLSDAFLIKLFFTIYIGITAFSKNKPLKKSLSDFSNIMGMKPNKASKNAISEGFKVLKAYSLIRYDYSQKHLFLKKIFSFTLEFDLPKAANDVISRKEIILEPKVLDTRSEKFGDIYNKKEINFKNQNISKRIFSPSTEGDQGIAPKKEEKTSENKSKDKKFDNLNFFNFNGLDRLENPMTKKSVQMLLKKSSLNIDQLQHSVTRFVDSYSKSSKIKDPVKFLISHLLVHGEYFPAKKKKNEASIKTHFSRRNKLLSLFDEKSVELILQKTTLKRSQIELSIRRFSEYLEEGRPPIKNPPGFLFNHLVKFGEYVPPESFLEKRSKNMHYESLDKIVKKIKEDVLKEENNSVSKERDKSLEKKAKEEIKALGQRLKLPFVVIKTITENHLEKAKKLVLLGENLSIEALGQP